MIPPAYASDSFDKVDRICHNFHCHEESFTPRSELFSPSLPRGSLPKGGKFERRRAEAPKGLPEEFRKALSFWPVGEVQEVAERLQSVNGIIERLGLMQSDLIR